MAAVVVTSEPAIEPVSLATAKLHCKIDTSEDDDLVTVLISTARRWCEARIAQQFITATRVLYLDRLPGDVITIPYPPLQAVSGITYVDSGGTTQTWSSSLYDVDIKTLPGRIRPKWGQTWPDVREQMNAVAVTYTCGYGLTAATVPTPIRQAMLLLIGHWYENREAINVGNIVSDVPLTIESLLMSAWHGEVMFAGGAQ